MGVAVSTSLLVRWGNGFSENVNAAGVATYGRIEGFLSLGQITDPTQAVVVAQATLATTAVEQLTVTAGVEPVTGGDIPYEGFDLGDLVTMPTEDGASRATQRAMAFTVTEDAEGNPIFAAEFDQAALIDEQRWTQWLTQFTSGTLAGTATSAMPLPPPAPPSATVNDEIIRFTQPALDESNNPITLKSGESNREPVNRTGTFYKVVVTLDGPRPGFGTGPTVLTVYVNGVSVGTVTVPAGQSTAPPLFLAVPVKCVAFHTPDKISVNFTTVDGVVTGADVLCSVH